MTPIETLIEKWELRLQERNKLTKAEYRQLIQVVAEARSLLPQEREAIEEAYVNGQRGIVETLKNSTGELLPKTTMTLDKILTGSAVSKDASDYFTKKYGE